MADWRGETQPRALCCLARAPAHPTTPTGMSGWTLEGQHQIDSLLSSAKSPAYGGYQTDEIHSLVEIRYCFSLHHLTWYQHCDSSCLDIVISRFLLHLCTYPYKRALMWLRLFIWLGKAHLLYIWSCNATSLVILQTNIPHCLLTIAAEYQHHRTSA